MSAPCDAKVKRDLASLESPTKLAFSATNASSFREVDQELIRSAPASPEKQVSALGAGAAAESPASPDVSPGPSPEMVRAVKLASKLQSNAVHQEQLAVARKNKKDEVPADIDGDKKKAIGKARKLRRNNKAARVELGMGSPCYDIEVAAPSSPGEAGAPSERRAVPKAPPAPPSPPSPLACSNIFALLSGIGSARKTPDLEAALDGGRSPAGDDTPGRSLEDDMDAVADPEPPHGIFGRIGSAIKTALGGVVSAVKTGWRALGGLFRRRKP